MEAHAYLRPVADLSAQVDRAAAGIDVLDARIPDWEDYRADYLAGVPLLSSADGGVDLEPGGRMAAALLESLASGTSSGTLAAEARALETELRREPHVSRRIAEFLLRDETFTPAFPGLLRYVGWTAMTRFLRPVLDGLRRMAGPGAVASPLLPDLRIPPRDGATRRRRRRARASALLRLLRHALAVQTHRLPVL